MNSNQDWWPILTILILGKLWSPGWPPKQSFVSEGVVVEENEVKQRRKMKRWKEKQKGGSIRGRKDGKKD